MAQDETTPDGRRERARDRFKTVLLQRGNPRGQMFLILAATGLVGFVATALLRMLGVESMGGRYLLSVGIAYLAFLGMLGLWLTVHRRRRASNRSLASGADAYVFSDGLLVPPRIGPVSPQGLSSGVEAKADGGWGVDLGSSDGEGALLLVVLLIILAIVAAVFASAWIIVDAPILMAELLVDGALMAGMAQRLRPRAGEHWAFTAIRRTWIPFLITAVVFAFVGFVAQHYVPNATTLVEAVTMAAG